MKKILILVFAFTVVMISCKKNQLGGKSTVKGKVQHHSNAISGARVFIKFNASDFPGSDTTKYDTKVTADVDGNYSFKCYKGQYYLYAYGTDLSAVPPVVVGGVPVRVRNNETVEANLAVTED